MFLSLSGKNKFGFLDGSIPTSDLSHPLYNVWHRANTIILSWMVNSLSKDLATSVMYFTLQGIYGLICMIGFHSQMFQDSLRFKRKFRSFHKVPYR